MAGPQAEVIGDVEVGGNAGGVDSGLSAEEQAAFDSMRPDGDEPSEPSDPEPAPEPAPGEAPREGDTPTPDDDDDDEDPAAAAPAVDPKTGKEVGRRVNYDRYKRTKDQLKAEREARASEATKYARLEERLNILNQALTAVPAAAAAPAKPPEPEVKSPWDEPTIGVEDDAIAAIAQMQRRTEYDRQQGQQFQQEVQGTHQDQQLLTTFQRDAAAFAAAEPNFPAAYQYLKDNRLAEMAIAMFGADPYDPADAAKFTELMVRSLVNEFNKEEKFVVAAALKNGVSPAKQMMAMAKRRGFAPTAAAAPAAAAPAAAVPAAPAARAPAAPAAAVPATQKSVVAQIQAETDAAAASRSLSDAGGAPPPEMMSAERLANMSEKEFERMLDKLDPSQINALLGRPDEQ